jgi:hypothetical protein
VEVDEEVADDLVSHRLVLKFGQLQRCC